MFTMNQLRGLNALRCMVTSLGNNAWNLLAAAYWISSFLGMVSEFEAALDLAWGHVCTCAADATDMVASFTEAEAATG